MRKKKKKLPLHQKIGNHLRKHFHKHIHKALHFANHMHHQLLHIWELIVILVLTLGSWSFMFANLTWLNQNLYRNGDSEIAQSLLTAMQNPTTSLKQGNLISLWTMGTTIENTFAKWYCTYGAARISPEFFPYMDPNTQQRTWWGNAVDRCKNASDTWYKIWMTPSQWALIIYDAGGKFWSYGHVGKVMHYNKTLNKIIVRDMARVSVWTMSDRREDANNSSIKCFIYNSKTSIPTDTSTPIVPSPLPTVVPAPTVATTVVTTPTTPTIITPIISSDTHTAPTPPTIVPPIPTVVIPPQPTPPVVVNTPVVPTPVINTPVAVIPASQPIISQTPYNKQLTLTFDNLSDIAQHFMTQNNIAISAVGASPLQVGEASTLALEITDKNTGEKISWLLPFSFTILSTNDTLLPGISTINLINDGAVYISILAQKAWTATIVINMGDVKIGEVSFEVK